MTKLWLGGGSVSTVSLCNGVKMTDGVQYSTVSLCNGVKMTDGDSGHTL